MSEDERLELLGAISEAHTVIREAALRLRRQLSPKAPAARAAFKAEEGVFRLRRELQRLDPSEPEPAPRRRALKRPSKPLPRPEGGGSQGPP